MLGTSPKNLAARSSTVFPTRAARALASALATMALVAGCAGSHPSDRPLVLDCETALGTGRHGDPCDFVGECGMGAGTRRAAVCDQGTMLLVDSTESTSAASGPCEGTFSAEANATLLFSPAGGGCVDITMCTEGAGASLRMVHVCQFGPAQMPSDGEPLTACDAAITNGQDGDLCSGSFGCLADRVIRADGSGTDILPVFGWCDDGILRLAPSQTVIRGE